MSVLMPFSSAPELAAPYCSYTATMVLYCAPPAPPASARSANPRNSLSADAPWPTNTCTQFSPVSQRARLPRLDMQPPTLQLPPPAGYITVLTKGGDDLNAQLEPQTISISHHL
jgi:hypothetical protein